MERWRDMRNISHNVTNIKMRITRDIANKLNMGRNKYGDVFQGDPLQHLKEEVLDSLIYINILIKKIEEEEENHKCVNFMKGYQQALKEMKKKEMKKEVINDCLHDFIEVLKELGESPIYRCNDCGVYDV